MPGGIQTSQADPARDAARTYDQRVGHARSVLAVAGHVDDTRTLNALVEAIRVAEESSVEERQVESTNRPSDQTGPSAVRNVVREIGTFVLPGRTRDPAQGIREAQDAEAAGFGSIWLSERYDLKDIGVLTGAILSATSSITLASGIVAAGVRHPLLTASWASTARAIFGDRLVVGMGRGVGSVLRPQGLRELTLSEIADYADILRRLWVGETVTYEGTLGSFPKMKLAEVSGVPPPRLLLGCTGGHKGLKLAAEYFDGVFLVPFLTTGAVRTIRADLDSALARAGRDPSAVDLIHEIVTAPDLSEREMKRVVFSRLLTYLQMGAVGRAIIRRNNWDPAELEPVMSHPVIRALKSQTADQKFSLDQLVDVAQLLPPHWALPNAAIGNEEDCASRLSEYFDAGAGHIVLHGSSPKATSGVLDAWRRRSTR